MEKVKVSMVIKLNGEFKTYNFVADAKNENGNIILSTSLNLDDGLPIPFMTFDSGNKCGNIGELTNFTLACGEELYVGDVVELYNMRTGLSSGRTVVAKDTKEFIMGIKGAEFTNGISNDNYWQIRKIKSYTEMKHGDVINNIRYNLRED